MAPGPSSSYVCLVLGCVMFNYGQSLTGLEHGGYGRPDLGGMMLGIFYYEEKTK